MNNNSARKIKMNNIQTRYSMKVSDISKDNIVEHINDKVNEILLLNKLNQSTITNFRIIEADKTGDFTEIHFIVDTTNNFTTPGSR